MLPRLPKFLRRRPRSRTRRLLRRVAVGAAAGGLVVSLAGGLAWWLAPRPDLYPPDICWSQVLEDRDGQVLHLALANDGSYRVKTPLAHISPQLVQATLLQEDRHYRRHPGVNPLSLGRAVWGVITHQRLGGGSTITMQVARMRFGLNTRGPGGKFIQILRALQLERHYGKDAILEAYFNLAPYGGNVEGTGAAALIWCGKPVDAIGPREAAALAVLPQSPTRRRPRPEGENADLAAAQFRLWQRLATESGARVDALDAAYTLRPEHGPPRAAPHFARRLFRRYPDREQIHSTLDAQCQHALEQGIAEFVERRSAVGIHNAAALLVHAPTREVLAYVGSADFFNKEIHGQVDGITARRSPGSAIKPFVYALGLENGLIHPQSLLRDARRRFGAYQPENFDRGFAGPLPARDALYFSRNIPAVRLADRLPGDGFYGFLKRAGVRLSHETGYYGLTLSLGGAEVSMEEMGRLYSLLADDGRPRTLKFTRDTLRSAHPTPDSLLSAEARFLVRDMLRPRGNNTLADDPRIAWKTGTSHGFRDGWSAGIRGDYVLIVWVGNFDARPNPAFFSHESAAPLFFDLWRRVPLPVADDVPPAGVSRVPLCAVSGQLPTPHCRHCQEGWFIPGVSPIAPCSIHREVLIDVMTGRRVAADDGTRILRREVYEFWPPDLLELFRQAGLPRRDPPPLDPGTRALTSARADDAPEILSPQDSLVYTLRASGQRRRLPLQADAAPGVTKLYWFAGGLYLGSSAPAVPFFWEPTGGRWTVQVIDDHGRSAAAHLRVEMVQ